MNSLSERGRHVYYFGGPLHGQVHARPNLSVSQTMPGMYGQNAVRWVYMRTDDIDEDSGAQIYRFHGAQTEGGWISAGDVDLGVP